MQNRIIIHASSEQNDTIKVDVTKLQYFTTILNLGFDDALQENIFADVCTRNIDINVSSSAFLLLVFDNLMFILL